MVGVKRALAIHQLKAGAVHFLDFEALVMDLSAVSDALGMVIHGILGCPLFQESLLIIDFQNRRVSVRTGTLIGPKRENQFRVTGADRPYIGMTLPTGIHPILVDTGSSSGLSLQKELFDKQHFHEDPVVVSAAVGVSGELRAWKAARLASSVKIGTHVIHNPIVRTAGKRSLLGVEILRHFVITYDRKNDLVRLERDQDSPITSKSLRATGVALRRKPTGWTIWHIFPHAKDSAQRLKIGDQVTRIAGKPVSEYDCDTFADLNAVRDEIEIEVQRGAEKLTVSLPVVELVP